MNKPHPPEKGKGAVYIEKMKQEKHERIKAKKLAKIERIRDSLFKTGALKVISNQSKANSYAADPNFNISPENATSPFQNIDSAEHKMIDSSFEVVDTKLTFDEGNPDTSSTVIEPETESRCPVPEMIDHNYVSHSSLLCKMYSKSTEF